MTVKCSPDIVLMAILHYDAGSILFIRVAISLNQILPRHSACSTTITGFEDLMSLANFSIA